MATTISRNAPVTETGAHSSPVTRLPATSASSQSLNPFNPLTVIPFSLAEEVHVSLDVFDATGRRVAMLIDRAMQAGVHEVEWNGRSLSGEAMPSGMYVYRIRAGEVTHSRRMLLMK